MDMSGLVGVLVYLIVIGCVLGLLLYLVSISPIPEPFKGWLRFGVIVVGVLVLIFWLLSLVGGGPVMRWR